MVRKHPTDFDRPPELALWGPFAFRASLSRRLLLQVCARDSANHLPAGERIARGNDESVNGSFKLLIVLPAA